MKGISGDQIRARSPAGQTATCPMALVNRGLDRVSVGCLRGALTLTGDACVA